MRVLLGYYTLVYQVDDPVLEEEVKCTSQFLQIDLHLFDLPVELERAALEVIA